MSQNLSSSRLSHMTAWLVAIVFVAGLFAPFVGIFTGPVLGAWFVGTQKPRRGFLWQMLFTFIPALASALRHFSLGAPAQDLLLLSDAFLIALLAVLPFTFHRLVAPHTPGFFATLPLPLARIALPWFAASLHSRIVPDSSINIFLFYWLATIVVWMWNRELPAARIGAAFALGTVLAIANRMAGGELFSALMRTDLFSWLSAAAALILAAWALATPERIASWAARVRAVASLRSPATGAPIRVVVERQRETLLSTAGERFPIREGIPDFRSPADLTGDNGKYNHVYETIGGFYDDIQRAFCALKGWDREAYFRAYMSLLDVKPGDWVLETSVGTGLNYKYLPRGVKLAGLDLSPEMLANCQIALRRRHLDADLYLGNAEALPFADSSFDVVFHVGGINFFNDRAKAIREMIRVAKPGSRLLIADETEKHVKGIYEKQPGSAYRNRKEPVRPPVELIPAEMEDIHCEELRGGEFYALTFRKPAVCPEFVTVL